MNIDILKIVKFIEKFVIIVLVFLMGLVVFFSAIELLIYIVRELIVDLSSEHLLIEKYELMKIFGLFFNVLIGLELFETVHLYLKDNIIHAEFVLLVGITAIARKIIILDYEQISEIYVLMLGILVASLALGFYLVRLGQTLRRDKDSPNNREKKA